MKTTTARALALSCLLGSSVAAPFMAPKLALEDMLSRLARRVLPEAPRLPEIVPAEALDFTELKQLVKPEDIIQAANEAAAVEERQLPPIPVDILSSLTGFLSIVEGLTSSLSK